MTGFGGVSRGLTSEERQSARTTTRTVMPNAMVAHVWAQQRQPEGRSGNGNLYFRDSTIFSYRDSWPLAKFTTRTIGNARVVVVNPDKYSVTTSGHLSDVRSALSGLDGVRVVEVPALGAWLDDMREFRAYGDDSDVAREAAHKARVAQRHRKVFEHYRDAIGEAELAAAKADAYKAAHPDSYRSGAWSRDAAQRLRREWQSYVEAFKPGLRMPADCGKVLADAKAAERRAADAEKVANARRLAGQCNPDLSAMPWPAPSGVADSVYVLPVPAIGGDVNAWQLERRAETLAEWIKKAGTALHWLRRGKAAATLKDKVARFIAACEAAHPAYVSATEAQCAYEKREETRKAIELIRREIGGEKGAVKAAHAVFHAEHYNVQSAAADLLKRLASWQEGDVSDVVAWLTSQVSLHLWHITIDRQKTVPAWRYSAQRNRKTEAERRAAWLAGLPDGAGFRQDNPTLIRRRGDTLETSRGASAPFGQAVLIFLKAQSCRAAGKGWHRNGERMPAGHFELERIDSEGNITIGCHRIAFAEMQRLAIETVPHTVKARFPVPAII
jgi:hypothetical protein